MYFSEKELAVYAKLGIDPPEHFEHGTEEEIRANLKPLKAIQWTLEGNKLIAHTSMGTYVNFIPTNKICHGMDSNGLPILKDVVL
jgi:hypothetical protein